MEMMNGVVLRWLTLCAALAVGLGNLGGGWGRRRGNRGTRTSDRPADRPLPRPRAQCVSTSYCLPRLLRPDQPEFRHPSPSSNQEEMVIATQGSPEHAPAVRSTFADTLAFAVDMHSPPLDTALLCPVVIALSDPLGSACPGTGAQCGQ